MKNLILATICGLCLISGLLFSAENKDPFPNALPAEPYYTYQFESSWYVSGLYDYTYIILDNKTCWVRYGGSWAASKWTVGEPLVLTIHPERRSGDQMRFSSLSNSELETGTPIWTADYLLSGLPPIPESLKVRIVASDGCEFHFSNGFAAQLLQRASDGSIAKGWSVGDHVMILAPSTPSSYCAVINFTRQSYILNWAPSLYLYE